jgi:hypothetical protein
MSYSFDDYARMLAQPVRGEAYLAALRETVRPGAVVADIGAGPGMLGIYAATLGARRVFLVEPDHSANAAMALAEENGVGERIEVIRAPSTEIELPELADVIISDLRGVTPFHEHHLAAAADMRKRLLAPGGVCIPQRDVVMTALVEDDALYQRTVHAWSGVPVSLSRESFTTLVANRWYRTRAEGGQMLSDPSPFVTLDYDRPSPPIARSWETIATRAGIAHGLLLWFDAELTSTIAFSNAPTAPAALYGQAFFPFWPALEVRRGERLSLGLRGVLSGDDYAWSWSATDERGLTVRHSTLRGIPLDATALARLSDDAVPRRSAEAEVQLAVLDAADGRTTLRTLARALAERFPERFPTIDAAQQYVSSLTHLWAQ